MSMRRVFFLCCWKRVFAMIRVFSWQHYISLCPASYHIPRPNLHVTPGVSWLPTFAFQSPKMKRTSFLGVSSKSLVGLPRAVQLQLLQHYRLGHRLGLLWYSMVCRGHEQRFCRFWDCTQVLHFRLFCWPWWPLHFFWGIPTVVDTMVIWVKFTHSIDFPGGSDGKASAYNAREPGSIPGSGRSPGEGNGNLLQYSCPPQKRGAQCIPWESAYVTNQSFFPQRTVTSTSIPKPSMHLSDHCLLNTNWMQAEWEASLPWCVWPH